MHNAQPIDGSPWAPPNMDTTLCKISLSLPPNMDTMLNKLSLSLSLSLMICSKKS
jgi:hypothetical protein